MEFNPLALPLAGSGIIMLAMSFAAWRFRATPGARIFSLLALSTALYSLGYGAEISSASLPKVLFWLKVEYLGISMMPPLYILFALDYVGRGKRLSFPVYLALFTIPVITLVLFYTNEHHQLYYRAVRMATEGPFPVISFERGPWYWVQAYYIGFAVVTGGLLFLVTWFNTGATYRNRLSLMLAGSLVPWAAHLIYQLQQTRGYPWRLDLAPFALAFSSALFFWGLWRYQLLDIKPIARTTLFEETLDGVLVVDKYGRVVDGNLAAARYLGNPVGLPASEVLEPWMGHQVEGSEALGRDKVETTTELAGSTRHFELEFLPLLDGHQAPRGHLVIMRDITERKHHEEQLRFISLHDHLTGLYNRSHFEAEMKRLESNGEYPITIMSADLDGLKAVNDTFGHARGDELLKRCAGALRKALRKTDILARVGGDEFAVLLPGSDEETGKTITDRICSFIDQHNRENPGLSLSVSLGMATSGGRAVSLEDTYRQADHIMYREKMNRRTAPGTSS